MLSRLPYKLHYVLTLILVMSLLTSKGFCRKREYGPLEHHQDIGYTSWFTGPLLSPVPINMQPEHPAMDVAVIAGSTYGQYDHEWKFKSSDNEWFINPSFDFEMGFTDRIGLEIFVPMITNFKKGMSCTHLQDITLWPGFQIANDIKGQWTPNIRLDWQLTFPTGKHHKLSPEKLGIDGTGFGAFQTGPVFIIHKEFYPRQHPLALKASLVYLFPSNVTVKGHNVYGGGPDTRGKVHPGQTFSMFLSLEYSFTQQWGGGFDALYIWQNKSTFSGYAGFDKNGQPVHVGLPKSNQFSLAPYIERTFSAQLGSIFGAWFTLGGQNSRAFASGYYALVYVF